MPFNLIYNLYKSIYNNILIIIYYFNLLNLFFRLFYILRIYYYL